MTPGLNPRQRRAPTGWSGRRAAVVENQQLGDHRFADSDLARQPAGNGGPTSPHQRRPAWLVDHSRQAQDMRILVILRGRLRAWARHLNPGGRIRDYVFFVRVKNASTWSRTGTLAVPGVN